MFVALLGKQLGVRPEGGSRRPARTAKPDSFRSVADVRDAQSLEKVRSAMRPAQDEGVGARRGTTATTNEDKTDHNNRKAGA